MDVRVAIAAKAKNRKIPIVIDFAISILFSKVIVDVLS